jgi:hypothetical protein
MSGLATALTLLGAAPGMTLEQATQAVDPKVEWVQPTGTVQLGSISLAGVDGVLGIESCGDTVHQVIFEAVYHAWSDRLAEITRKTANKLIEGKLGATDLIEQGLVHSECDRSLSEEAGWVRCVDSEDPVGAAREEFDRLLSAYQTKYGEHVQPVTSQEAQPTEQSFTFTHKTVEYYVLAGYRIDNPSGPVHIEFACSSPSRPFWCSTLVRMGEPQVCMDGI